MNATRASRFDWLTPIKAGLLGGMVAVFLALVGIVEASSKRQIVQGVISMGQLLLLLAYLLAVPRALRPPPGRQGQPQPMLSALLSGALAGLLTSAMLAALVLIGQVVNLRPILIHASPEMYGLLTLGLGLRNGILALLGVGLLLGVLLAAILSLPGPYRRAVLMGLLAVPTVAVLYTALFAGRGLSAPVAAAIFIGVGAVTYAWIATQARVRQQFDRLPPNQRRPLSAAALALGVAAVLLLPRLGSYPSEVLDLVFIYGVLMGLGLNIVVGFAGLLDLGYVAFFAIGAYAMGVLTSPEIHWLPVRLTFWEALPFAVFGAVLSGVILGIPVLQMRGDYLAIVTLGFGEIVRLLALSDWLKPFIGGTNGITLIPKPLVFPIKVDTPPEFFYILLGGIVIAAFIAVRLKSSRLGRNWMAMREDEDVAQAMGIDLVRNKLLAFATGAGFAGLSGAIFASKLGSIYPHSFNILVSFNVLAVIIIGGMGSIPGVVVGALALIGLPELLREFAEYRLLVYGAALVFMMLNRPEGLWPEARRRLELHEAGPDVAE